MPRLVHDRYVAYDDVHGCDLATGEDVRLDALDLSQPTRQVPSVCELLDAGQDGWPRWVVLDVRNATEGSALTHAAAVAAGNRGFVPILVSLYERLRGVLATDLEDRSLLLIGGFARSVGTARAALLEAASRTPRPHLLLTFRTNEVRAAGGVVREARAAYGPKLVLGRPVLTVPASDIARHLERASRATEFRQAGRHAAAERLLRDVAGTLIRRDAHGPAAQVSIELGRLLLERGRAGAADKAFGDAAQLAERAGHGHLAVAARIWQALARTDGGRLTEAESICRAVLLTVQPSTAAHAWARAGLARVLWWQGRLDEALRCERATDAEPLHEDAVVAASIDATWVRILVSAGEIFRAGLRVRALLDRGEATGLPMARLIASIAHLRLLSATGDLFLAGQALASVEALARTCRAPWYGVRARIIWCDALRQAGRTADAQRQLARVTRMRRIAPALLRRAIDSRAANSGQRAHGAPTRMTPAHDVGAVAVELMHLVHDQERDADALHQALNRLVSELRPSRIDLVTADAGPPASVAQVGVGMATQIGQRVLEAGILIDSDAEHGAREIGAPVRLGPRLVGALVCRWPADRQPAPHASSLLPLVAAIIAPRLEALVTDAREDARAAASVPELLGISAAMADVRRSIERAARAPFSVLVEGESGVGKELAARAIHQLSPRRDRRFCDVNCAAFPDDLLESELFGHARGAFTGAVVEKAGLFEDADGGTLFLDEVPDLSTRAQAKLLRAVQQQEVRRVGETFSRKVDVRLVAAANRDMRAEAAAKRFRADLLFRLDVIHIRIPPLRERPEDIPLLARHFWRDAAERVGSRASLTHAVLAALTKYPWPGNVRELQNVMAALAVAAPPRGRVGAVLLPAIIAGATVVGTPKLAEARMQFERRCIEMALARAGGSRTRAAADLGLSRQGLLKTMARVGIVKTQET